MHTFEVYWFDKGCCPKFANNAILLVIGISALIITNFGSRHITEMIKEKISLRPYLQNQLIVTCCRQNHLLDIIKK